MSLEGVLSDFGVGEIFQLIGQQRKTGVLEVRSADRTVEVSFVEGQVLRARPAESRPDAALGAFLLRTGVLAEADLAEARREQDETLDRLEEVLLRQERARKDELEQIAQLLTEETIFELFLWDEGRFAFRPEEEFDERIGDRLRGSEGVLLDALRMRDEWARIENVLPDFEGIPSPCAGMEVFARQRTELEEAASLGGEALERLYTLADGRLTIRRVIDLSRLGTFEGARGVTALISQRLLRVERKDPVVEVEEKPRQSPLPRLLAPFASLALLPVAIALLAVPAPEAGTYPLGYDVLEETRSLDDHQRLRAALEIARWQQGRYPDSLAALRDLSPALLARIPLDEYSYSRTAGGYALDRRYSPGRAAPGQGGPSGAESRAQPGQSPSDGGALALSASAEPPEGETAAPSPPSVP
jgi:hypothetical protein